MFKIGVNEKLFSQNNQLIKVTNFLKNWVEVTNFNHRLSFFQ